MLLRESTKKQSGYNDISYRDRDEISLIHFLLYLQILDPLDELRPDGYDLPYPKVIRRLVAPKNSSLPRCKARQNTICGPKRRHSGFFNNDNNRTRVEYISSLNMPPMPPSLVGEWGHII